VQHDNDGPKPQLSLPSFALLRVGAWVIAPTPQIQLPGFAGERNAVNCRSLIPLTLLSFGLRAGSQTTGKMVRVIMFQSSFTEIGMTGWMLRMF
jgi:hypothetical protein